MWSSGYIHDSEIMGPCGVLLDGWLKMEMCWLGYSCMWENMLGRKPKHRRQDTVVLYCSRLG